MTTINRDDLEELAVGAALLGTGGGGDPYTGKLLARAAVERYGSVTLLPLDDVPDDFHVVACGAMGAPTILIEKVPGGDELELALATYEEYTGRKVDALIPFEAGGVNSMAPITAAARRGLPVIDADGMGRAFPKLEMETFHVYGVPVCPVIIADERGNTVIVETPSAPNAEWLARGVTIRMGGQSWLVNYGMDGTTARRVSVPGTVSLALGIGRAMRSARLERRDVIDDLLRFFAATHYERAALIASGKISDVSRRTSQGWSIGTVTIEPFESGQPAISIQIQNENLVTLQGDEVLAIVPDLICILDLDTAEPITTERLRYGQRVNVLAVQVPPIMRTPEALAVFGPRAFGLPYDYSGLLGGPARP